MVESHYRYKEDTCTIRNTWAVVMLVRWLLTIPGAVQPWLAARLCHLCTTEAHNRQQCCSVGLLRVVVEVLAASQEEGRGFSEEVEGQITGAHFTVNDYMIALLPDHHCSSIVMAHKSLGAKLYPT